MFHINFISFIYVVISYITFVVFVCGVIYKFLIYMKTPQFVNIVLTPSPTSRKGVYCRMLSNIIFLRTLFKSDKFLWLISYLFHLSFLAILLQHFLRHITFDFNSAGGNLSYFYNILLPIGFIIGLVVFVTLLFLLFRRFFIERVKYISLFQDHFILILLLSIALSGLSQVVFQPVGELNKIMPELDHYFNNLITLKTSNIPLNPYFLLHYTLILVLLNYLPFSKLIHFIGVIFAPTLNREDNFSLENKLGMQDKYPTL